jgi:uncharacterized protein (TIGR03118 family)
VKRQILRRRAGAAAIGVAVSAALVAAVPIAASNANAYVLHSLTASGAGSATFADPSLVNPWGLVAGPTTPWWTANNGSNTSTLYGGDGAKRALTVTVDGGTTGTVFNGATTGFALPGGTAGARFIFSSEDGKIRGWAAGTTAVVTADASGRGAVYKGLAIATLPDNTQRLYATDFHNGRVDIYDQNWQPVTIAGAFRDAKLPKGLAPFGIQTIGQRVVVTYAKQDSAKRDDVAGPAQGWFSVFDLNGKLLSRVGANGPLNAPWGTAIAPANWGKFGGDLLVGNFGDGRISVYTERSNGKWAYLASLRNGAAQPLQIDGLWALQWGNGSAAGPADTLYFTAGPNAEKAGLLGSITPE